MSYGEPELVKTAEAPVYHPGSRPVPRPRKSLEAVKHSITVAAKHSLEVAAQEFKKIREPKIAKLKGAAQLMLHLFLIVGSKTCVSKIAI